MTLSRHCLAFLFTALAMPAMAQIPPRYLEPVKAVAPNMLEVPYAGGTVGFPVYTSVDWTVPQPGITRAVLIFHGLLRNADSYFKAGLKAQKAAGASGAVAMIVAPQFLADFDVPAHHLPANTLGWNYDRWARGEPALTPAPLSGFDAIDAVLAHLSDRTLFPKLQTVVIAGFSAGAQIVQRYAVVGRGEDTLTRAGIATEYVVSDPSSFLYFNAERPIAEPLCKTTDTWHYGFSSGVPPYVQGMPAALEQRYAARHVTYLMGMADTDPNHPVLDKSCAGEAQGPQRFARGHAYYAMMQARSGAALKQRLIDVPGIAHEGGKMFNTDCGLAVLFGKPGCAALDQAQ